MGNTGRPSTGCSRCRKRRVKCDERRPGCFRCAKLGEQCPGYTHGYWIFRDESDTARKRVLKQSRRAEPSSSASPASAASPGGSDGTASNDTPSPSNSLIVSRHIKYDKECQGQPLSISQPALYTDIEFRSVCLFMETFTLDSSTEGKYPAHLDFLPGMYMSPSSDVSIHKAVKAIALTNFANRYGAKELASSAWKAYGEALSATNTALRNPDQATSDAVMAAVYLLGLNELICRPDMPLLGGVGWHSHVFGTLQLLRLRWNQRLKTTTERQLFHMVHSTVLIKYMMGYEFPPADSMAFILAEDYPDGLGAKIATAFFCRSVEMRAKLHQKGMAVYSSSEEEIEELKQLIDEAYVLLQSRGFENWTDHETDWQVKPSANAESVRTDRFTFQSQYISLYWVYHWTVRICLQKSMIDALLVLLAHEHDREETTAIQTKISLLKEGIQAEVEKVLGAVEFCLTGFYSKKKDPTSFFHQNRATTVTSSVGALPMFWALGTIRHMAFADPIQKNIATAALRRVGTENSIAQALLHVY